MPSTDSSLNDVAGDDRLALAAGAACADSSACDNRADAGGARCQPTRWSVRRRCFWLVVATLAVLVWGPGFFDSLRPPRELILDFFQEWASARNAMAGLPVYSPQSVALEKHLGYRLSGDETFWLEWNAHPPTSVLLIMPLAVLDYPEAFLTWNLISLALLTASLWLIVRELQLPFSPWWLLPLVTALLAANPFRQQVNQGQLNLVLLALLTGAWSAHRRGDSSRAGALLGAATAIKLFPGFLFLYFAARRDGKCLAAGAASFALLTGLTLWVLSPAAYRDYVEVVLPQVVVFRDWWANVSLWGFWHKLFDGSSGHVVPSAHLPLVAKWGSIVSALIVAGLVAWTSRRARTPSERDAAFSLAIVGMLLASPIAWDHYFLLLLIPLAVFWRQLPEGGAWRWSLLAMLVLLSLNPKLVWDRTIAGPGELQGGVAQPIHAITVLAYQCYALLALFLLGLCLALWPQRKS